MDNLETAYFRGMTDGLVHHGFSEKSAEDISTRMTVLKKEAGLFNFSDSDNGSGYGNVVAPILASLIFGTLGYQAGIKGDPDKGFMTNSKNYLYSLGNSLVRRRVKPLYDIDEAAR